MDEWIITTSNLTVLQVQHVLWPLANYAMISRRSLSSQCRLVTDCCCVDPYSSCNTIRVYCPTKPSKLCSMPRIQANAGTTTFQTVVARESLIENAMASIMSAPTSTLRSGQLWVAFEDKEGAGQGIRREFLSTVCTAIQEPALQRFMQWPAESSSCTVHPTYTRTVPLMATK